MAYSGSQLSLLVGTIEGSFNIFVYNSSDTVTTVIGANYFSDGEDRGMQIGDFLYAVCLGIPYMLYVSAQNGVAFTATPIALAMLNGSNFPTTNPGAGSGLVWNNAGFLCVA